MGNAHSALHCSLHHLEYRNVDGCTLKWCCGHFSYCLRVRYIAQHVFVSGQNIDVYDVPVYGDLYSMGVVKRFQYGLGPMFPVGEIICFHWYRVLYAF